MCDDNVGENLDDDFLQCVVSPGETVEEEVEVVIREILVAVNIARSKRWVL